ncbi:peptidyl-tRNA hydrolase protein 1 [Podila minutissima]|uniref:Peptidyl-tRNA hydrolase n=1 Tax=Podila minutissima TaxID=64525 RepID=A0A9P5VQR7_9FUNG|nr:peptidyl-tRNA hydrolase protein 1 [Podila minutissima]
MATSSKHILVVGLGNYTHPGTRHNVGMMVVDSIAERFNAAWTKKGAWQAEIATATTSIRMKVPKQKGNLAPGAIRAALASLNKTEANTATSTAPTGEAAGAAEAATTMTTAAPERIKRQPEIMTMELKLTLLKPLQLMNVSGTSVSRAARDLGIPATDILVIHDDMERDLGKLSFKNEGSANGHNGIKSCVKALGTQHFRRLRVGIGRPEDRSPKIVSSFVLGRFKPLEVVKLEELVYPKAGDEIIRTVTVVHGANRKA